jgi:hypothetical protein
VLTPRERTRDEWAEAIREAYAAIRGAFGDTLERAIALGGLFGEAKSSGIIDHGDWEGFVDEDCGVSPRTARDYMRLSDRLSYMTPEERRLAAEMGMKQVLKELAGEEEVARLAKGADLEPEWDASQTARRHQAEMGQTVIANMHRDHALQKWKLAT